MRDETKNVIPRKAARLYIVFMHDHLRGVRAVVEKDITGTWIATTEHGEKYTCFASHLRMREYCIIERTATAEEIENEIMHPYHVTYVKKGLERSGVFSSQDATESAETVSCESSLSTPETRPQSATETAETTASAEAVKATQRDTESTTTGDTPTDGTTAETPRHACENAPQRTERGRAVQTTTPPGKRSLRGKFQNAPNFRSQKNTRSISVFWARFFREIDLEFSGLKTGTDPPGVSNLVHFGRRHFFKFFSSEWRQQYEY